MNWLLVPLIPKNRWPAVKHGEKRGITLDEHRRIVEREQNSERKAFYEMCWHVGAAQSDVAALKAEDIDWQNGTLNFIRQKTKEPVHMAIGPDLERLLRSLPQTGLLFPYLAGVRECDRATEFKQRCKGLEISGVTLHSYRYGWAERARAAGYPERFAQEALGHGSKAVHRAYAKRAQVKVPSLDAWEKEMREKVVPFRQKPQWRREDANDKRARSEILLAQFVLGGQQEVNSAPHHLRLRTPPLFGWHFSPASADKGFLLPCSTNHGPLRVRKPRLPQSISVRSVLVCPMGPAIHYRPRLEHRALEIPKPSLSARSQAVQARILQPRLAYSDSAATVNLCFLA